ncbi:MAG: class I SAM-dependent methyltransferase [Cyclobacteriaceae bacterium]
MNSESMDTWKYLGKNDPYFGVLSDEKYRMGKLSEDRLSEFFDTGKVFVEQTRKRVWDLFGTEISNLSVLDFGCGVGRLAIPFAGFSDKEVLGIDISEEIIQRAITHQQTYNQKNLSFQTYDGENLNQIGNFDFINSYIVFQHIEPRKGMMLLRQLLDHLNWGGILQVQLTHGQRLPLPTYLNFYLRTKFRPYNFIYSSLKNRKLGAEPTMQMNHYSPKKLFGLFSEFSNQVHVEFTDHGGHLGAFYLLKKARQN